MATTTLDVMETAPLESLPALVVAFLVEGHGDARLPPAARVLRVLCG